jgi:hypothetical protein
MDKQHMIIIGLACLALILAIVLIIKGSKKESYSTCGTESEENFDYGYPYTYPAGFTPPPDGVVLSTMKEPEFNQNNSNPMCMQAANSYCVESNKPDNQAFLGDPANARLLLDVATKCGHQFPIKQYCKNTNPQYEDVNLIRGGIQSTPTVN